MLIVFTRWAFMAFKLSPQSSLLTVCFYLILLFLADSVSLHSGIIPGESFRGNFGMLETE